MQRKLMYDQVEAFIKNNESDLNYELPLKFEQVQAIVDKWDDPHSVLTALLLIQARRHNFQKIELEKLIDNNNDDGQQEDEEDQG